MIEQRLIQIVQRCSALFMGIYYTLQQTRDMVEFLTVVTRITHSPEIVWSSFFISLKPPLFSRVSEITVRDHLSSNKQNSKLGILSNSKQ